MNHILVLLEDVDPEPASQTAFGFLFPIVGSVASGVMLWRTISLKYYQKMGSGIVLLQTAFFCLVNLSRLAMIIQAQIVNADRASYRAGSPGYDQAYNGCFVLKVIEDFMDPGANYASCLAVVAYAVICRNAKLLIRAEEGRVLLYRITKTIGALLFALAIILISIIQPLIDLLQMSKTYCYAASTGHFKQLFTMAVYLYFIPWGIALLALLLARTLWKVRSDYEDSNRQINQLSRVYLWLAMSFFLTNTPRNIVNLLALYGAVFKFPGIISQISSLQPAIDLLGLYLIVWRKQASAVAVGDAHHHQASPLGAAGAGVRHYPLSSSTSPGGPLSASSSDRALSRRHPSHHGQSSTIGAGASGGGAAPRPAIMLTPLLPQSPRSVHGDAPSQPIAIAHLATAAPRVDSPPPLPPIVAPAAADVDSEHAVIDLRVHNDSAHAYAPVPVLS